MLSLSSLAAAESIAASQPIDARGMASMQAAREPASMQAAREPASTPALGTSKTPASTPAVAASREPADTASREAILAARRERRAAAKKDAADTREAIRAGRARRAAKDAAPYVVEEALVARLEALDLSPAAVEIAPHAGAADAFARATAATRRTFQTSNRACHQIQLESLVALLERRGLLGADVRVVELGAGKGLLGGLLFDLGLTGLSPIALDRRACATTNYDHAGADAPEASPRTVRVVVDLATCDDLAAALAAVPGGAARPLLLGKHFCGAASDVAVRAATILGLDATLALAPCCHPQITWETYAGRSWLEARGFDERQFEILKDLVRLSKPPRPEDRVGAVSGGADVDLLKVGALARRVIEEGRLAALRATGFRTELVQRRGRAGTFPCTRRG